MMRTDLFDEVETLYSQARPRLYLPNLAPVLFDTYEPWEWKKLEVIERLVFAKWRSIQMWHTLLSLRTVEDAKVWWQSHRKQCALCFMVALSSIKTTSLSTTTKGATSTATQNCWGKILENFFWGAYASWKQWCRWRQAFGFKISWEKMKEGVKTMNVEKKELADRRKQNREIFAYSKMGVRRLPNGHWA